MSPRSLPASPSVASLRKQAKQLLGAYDQQEAAARTRVQAVFGAIPEQLRLREAQRVIASEYGFASWAALRQAVDAALAAGDPAPLVANFLDLACLTYASSESPRRIRRAERMLAEHPELGAEDVCALAARGEAERLAARLDGARELVSARGGPRHWPPLLYLCYARVAQRDALRSAEILLARGADPNCYFMWPNPDGPCKYTALTGVFGHGESGPIAEPPHPERDRLARLLLEAGADPNDEQTLYQCHFTPDDGFLRILLPYGLDLRTPGPWLLVHAAQRGFRERVELLLEHGVDPNGVDANARQAPRTAYENAVVFGHSETAELLLRAGARRVELSPHDAFQAACLSGDAGSARALLATTPGLIDDPTLLGTAAGRGNLRAVRLLLDLGAPPNPPDAEPSALHQACSLGHLDVVMELVARGADIDRRESYHHGTPADWADHSSHHTIAEFLAARSNDVFDVTYLGHRARLLDLLAADPDRIAARDSNGRGLLHHIDENAEAARSLVELLLERGAPFDLCDRSGETPLARFLRLGAEDLADALVARGASE